MNNKLNRRVIHISNCEEFLFYYKKFTRLYNYIFNMSEQEILNIYYKFRYKNKKNTRLIFSYDMIDNLIYLNFKLLGIGKYPIVLDNLLEPTSYQYWSTGKKIEYHLYKKPICRKTMLFYCKKYNEKLKSSNIEFNKFNFINGGKVLNLRKREDYDKVAEAVKRTLICSLKFDYDKIDEYFELNKNDEIYLCYIYNLRENNSCVTLSFLIKSKDKNNNCRYTLKNHHGSVYRSSNNFPNNVYLKLNDLKYKIKNHLLKEHFTLVVKNIKKIDIIEDLV